jgi:putative salt-induced outer membrane protein
MFAPVSSGRGISKLRTLQGLTLMLVLAAGAACAQSPSGASGGSSKAKPGVSGKATLGFLSTSGNTESTNSNAALMLVYQLEAWAHRFNLSAIGASSANETTAEAYQAKYEARRDIREHGYAFTAVDWNRDRFSGYERQDSVTAGYGRRLIDRERHSLDGGLGLGVRESLPTGGVTERDAVARLSLGYVWTISETSEFDQSLVVETGSTNTSTESVSSLKAGLFGNVALVLSYRLKNNSFVPPGNVNTDRYSSVSLEYSF